MRPLFNYLDLRLATNLRDRTNRFHDRAVNFLNTREVTAWATGSSFLAVPLTILSYTEIGINIFTYMQSFFQPVFNAGSPGSNDSARNIALQEENDVLRARIVELERPWYQSIQFPVLEAHPESDSIDNDDDSSDIETGYNRHSETFKAPQGFDKKK